MFEWDKKKAVANRKKHGISFDEVEEIFAGPILSRLDDRQDYGEERWISIGATAGKIVIVVAHTDRVGNIRIISARRANNKERQIYHDHLKKAQIGAKED